MLDISINNNYMIISSETRKITIKELKEKIKAVEMLGFTVDKITIKFNYGLEIEEIGENSKLINIALDLYKKSTWNKLEITNIKNKKIEINNKLNVTLENQYIDFIQVDFLK